MEAELPSAKTWPVRILLATATATALLALTAPQVFGATKSARAVKTAVNPWPTPPFAAWIKSDFGYVRDKPTHASKLVALLRLGDSVKVVGCAPSCDVAHPWALLEPRGAVPLSHLRAGEPDAVAKMTGSSATYFYGRTPRARTPVFAKPDANSKVIRKEKAEFRLAFVPNAYLSEMGWVQRPDGGYMRKADLKLFTPSTFVGQKDPETPLAFVRRKVALRLPGQRKPPKIADQITWHARYDRLPVHGLRGDKVEVKGGWLPKSLVRIVNAVERPQGVSTSDRWLHVDLGQQFISAYEGDKMVYATLVSTGKSGRASTRTHTGRFELYGKTVHGSMRGKPWDDYYAEEVPYVMHFDGGRALHGAYWHDQFGIEKSHGCINLSPADAAWIFAWATPAVPAGWHNVLPTNWGGPVVTVMVDSPNKRETKPRKLAFAPLPQLAVAKR
ncbi:MAG: murein L,D-transpeptidase [Myxococcales bacterium]|nr:murein L,D-transpeptidase [Myxococcales bacterium]